MVKSRFIYLFFIALVLGRVERSSPPIVVAAMLETKAVPCRRCTASGNEGLRNMERGPLSVSLESGSYDGNALHNDSCLPRWLGTGT